MTTSHSQLSRSLGVGDDGEMDGAALPTGTVTLLLSDVEGSTRLWEARGDIAPLAIARHYELIDAAVAVHGGVRPVEQGEGDSVVVAFSRASDAIATALDVQRAFAEEDWPGDLPVQVRIALHTGEVDLRDEGNYFGPTIIRCARLRGIAHGGQVLVSEATRDLVVERLPDGMTLRELGSHRLKDLGRPERVWQLCPPELTDQFHRVARGPVLDDLPVLEAADHDAAQLNLATAVGSAEGPAGGDPVALADLLLDLEAQVGKELQVERDRAAGAVVAPVGEPVDVVDEVGVVDGGDPVEVLARTDLLEGAAGCVGLTGGGGCRHQRFSSFRLRTQSG